MEGLFLVAFISTVFVTLNFGLQLYWFYWSTQVQERKHFTDEAAEMDRVKALFDAEEAKRKKAWEQWIPVEHRAPHPFDGLDIPLDLKNIHSSLEPKRDEQGKFNPDEIDGKLDGFFTTSQDADTDTDGGDFK